MPNELIAGPLAVNQLSDGTTAPSVEQRLEQLARRANEAHFKVGSVLEQGLLCAYGAGQALLEAVKLCPKRQWVAWLAANFRASRWTARRYMKFARECNRLGGVRAAISQQTTAAEAVSALKKLTVLPSGERKRKSSSGRAPAPPRPVSAARSQAQSPPVLVAESRVTAGAGSNPYEPLRKLLEGLMNGLRAVIQCDDPQDAPVAELLLLDLEPVYADLMAYLDDRDRLRRTA